MSGYPVPPRRSPSPGYEYDVAMGRVEGVHPAYLTTYRANQSTISGSITIWDATESEGDSGNIQFLSSLSDIWLASNNASDTEVYARVDGLDNEYNEISEVIQLQGQTPVKLNSQLQYVQLVTLMSQGVLNVGDVYVNAASAFTAGVPDDVTKIQSKIKAGMGMTHNGWLIIPKGMMAVAIGVGSNTDAPDKPAQVSVRVRPPGYGFFLTTAIYNIAPSFNEVGSALPLGSNSFAGERRKEFAAGSIIEVRSKASANSTNVFFNIDFILEPESIFGV